MGRGSYYRSSRDTTSSYRVLDIRRFQRQGVLQPGREFNWQWSREGEVIAWIRVTVEPDCVRLSYRNRRGEHESWQEENYPVTVEWTRCNYGGSRAWFRCPAAGCGRRVAILYGGGIFACRHCYGLNYQSQHEQGWDRALSRTQNIRVKLGGEPGLGYPFP